MRRTRLVALAASAALFAGLGGVAVVSQSATAAPNPVIDPGNGHAFLGNKPLPHPSGGAEVTYDERAQSADLQSTIGSDTPPDATVSALGCANRGSATNPRANQDCTLRRQAEEQVRVNPRDPKNVLVGQNDSRVGFNKCGFDYSLDGGATWGDGQPPFFQHLSLVGHTYDAASDPALAFDSSGRAWYSCVVFDLNTNASGLFAVPSTRGLEGSAYANVAAGASRYVVAEDASGANFYDKEFLAGDPKSPTSAVYVTFTDFQAATNCKRAANKSGQCQSPIMISKWTGTAWTTPVQISGQAPFCVGGNAFNPQLPADACNQDQGSFPVVLDDGSVFVAFSNFNTPSLVNQQLGVHVHVTGDTLTADPPVRVGLDNENGAALCDFGRGPEQCVDSLHIRSDDFPALAVDPKDSTHLVATWTDTRTTPAAGSGNYDVVVSESTDGGETWSDGTGSGGGGTVLTTAGAYFEPSVAVTTSHKTVVSGYQTGTAKHTATIGDGTFGYGFWVDPVSGSAAYTPASDSQTNPSPQANASQRGFLGDYSSVAADTTGSVYMTWSDTRNASSAGPDEDVFVFKTTP